jgi:hypothetical protein
MKKLLIVGGFLLLSGCAAARRVVVDPELKQVNYDLMVAEYSLEKLGAHDDGRCAIITIIAGLAPADEMRQKAFVNACDAFTQIRAARMKIHELRGTWD